MLRSKRSSAFGMAFVFSLVVFVIISLTVLLSGVVMRWLLYFDLVSMEPPNIIVINALTSLLFGVLLAALSSRAVLRPIRTLMNAMNALAKGDFETRVDLAGALRLREFAEAAGSFNDMAQQLGDTEMLHADFVRNFSHEFKTPIVSLRGFAELLRDETLTDAQRERYLNIIIGESDRLGELATNVLTLSRIENRTILTDCVEFDLTEHVRQVILLLEKQWTDKDLELSVELDELRYYGNMDLIKQMLLNIIGNAVKFSEPGGAVAVELRGGRDDVLIRVRDRGCGMDEQTAHHIFDKFYQGDSSHSTRGNGLGMAIVREILSLCRGEIRIESEPGAGTLVEVSLPCAQRYA